MSEAEPVNVQPVGEDMVEPAAETIAQAFRTDPVWGPALGSVDGSTDHLRPYWRHYIEGARRYDTVFATTGARTVSVWIPPGGTELSEEQEAGMRELALDSLGPERAAALFELWECFEANLPQVEPYAYLSLLATHPAHAGHRYGQAHLAADLARWDDAGLPSYLESTNPANDQRYARQGFEPIGQFTTPSGAKVTTMWRAVG
jgi:GNAT superfamily N-acetyltransferase